jgi:hypothetical protein
MEAGDELRRSFTCITRQPFQLIQTPDNATHFSFESMPRNRPIRLEPSSIPEPIHLAARIDLTSILSELTERRFTGAVSAYSITIRLGDGAELLAYHWHPNGLSNVRGPHLHVAARFTSPYLGKTHLPTGAVAIASIVHMLIADFGVAPLRADWRSILS